MTPRPMPFLGDARISHGGALLVLLDPDRLPVKEVPDRIRMFEASGVDAFLVGGSLNGAVDFEAFAAAVKSAASRPVIGFPGSTDQLSSSLDALLFLSVISGRNPDLLFGRHVQAAQHIKALGLETIATGYMLVESGPLTTAHYMSQTMPIPREKPSIAAATALAGEMLGLSLLYLDAGSGAQQPVPLEMITAVRSAAGLPLLVGGGIVSPAMAAERIAAGADGIVVGTLFEQEPDEKLVAEMASSVRAG